MVELLLALPIVLLLALGIAQFTLVYQAKHALDYALMQAARQGAVEHATAESIHRGFAAGLVPYLYGASDWVGLLGSEARAAAHVRAGMAAEWIVIRQRSPSLESFEDWSEPALDAMGEPIPGVIEIANDNLDSRRLRMQPASGVAGTRRSEPIGSLSGQTLADANLLRLELVYGVRLSVPLVGAMVIRMLALWNGCPRAADGLPRHERLGLLRMQTGSPPGSREPTQAWMCAFLAARDEGGRQAGRIPIRASATIRMMSPARRSTMTRVRVDHATGLASSGATATGPAAGDSWGSAGADPAPAASPAASGSTARPPPQTPQSNGFLAIGSDRAYPRPAAHPALCDG